MEHDDHRYQGGGPVRPEQGDMPPAQPLPEVTALLQALRQIKASKNLSLDAFTHDTGYSRSSWNRVLKGTAFPPRTAVERLCSRRGLDKEKLLGLGDTADQARRAADAQEETAAEAALVPVPATPAQGVPDPVPPTTPDPVPPTAPAPADPAPPTAPDPAPGTATPKPAAASPAPRTIHARPSRTGKAGRCSPKPDQDPRPDRRSPRRAAAGWTLVLGLRNREPHHH
jgi:hypothetical protein